MVWLNLYRGFCDPNKKPYEDSIAFPHGDEDYKKIWALFRNNKIYRPYRLVLGSTFDHVILETEKIQEFIDAVHIYAEDYPVGHLLKQCDCLSKFKKSKRYVGFAWNQTSVADTWGAYRRCFSAFDEGWYLFNEIAKYDLSEEVKR